jgi:ribosome-binding factor A
MKVDRMLRINEMIQHLLGEIIERDLKGYLPALVTVTGVKTAPDLQQAEVYVSVLGNTAARDAAMELLQQHRKRFQAGIARQVKMKFTPILKFHLDLTLERADRVNTILQELNLATTGTGPVVERPEPAPARRGPKASRE